MSSIQSNHMLRFSRLVTIFAMLGCLHHAERAEAQRVTILLRSTVTTGQSQVTLADVATIRTTESHVKRKLAAVDLCDFEKGETCIVSQQQIRLRLALAGYPVEQIELTGSDEVVVQFQIAEKVSDWSLQDAIALEVAKRIDRPVNEIRILVLRPLSSFLKNYADIDSQTLPEINLPEGPLTGRRSVEIRFYNEQDIYETRSISVEISIQQEELRVTKSLARGAVLSTQNLTSHVRFQRTISETVPFAEMIGRRVRRSMRIGEKVTAADLLAVESNTSTEIVVRQRDAIRLIARQGQLEFVVPRAEAMQNGRVGQVIRVKNLQSNRIVNARLVSAEEAVVDLP